MKATFGAGCFWGVEHLFREIEGVLSVTCGYEGGGLADPCYRDVCTGSTGHAEVVEIDFDESVVGFEDLCHAFWDMHDPTTLNRQGPDRGTQYRSAIFCHSDDQRRVAEASRDRIQRHFSSPVVTEITSASTFYRAEEYHQQYFEKNGGHGCHIRRRLPR